MDAPSITTFDFKAQWRFFNAFKAGAPDECWEWGAGRSDLGYGKMYHQGRHWVTSRIALEIKIGRALTEGEFACHHCDNPPCVNPDHLFAGTCADNQRDASEKGRLWSPGPGLGEAHPLTKFTVENVALVWRLRGELPASQIAVGFGVKTGAIYSIWDGRNWSHVTDELPRH